MGYYDYTPLHSKDPMSWPPLRCNWCDADEIVWAFPMGAVTFPRQVTKAGAVREIFHDAQPWYACERCKGYVDSELWEELAALLGHDPHHFDRLARAKMQTPGYRWATSLRAGR